MMNIYDAFMYFDEDILLDLRLNTLDKFVKKFVITEATYTHNGKKKKLNFDIDKFKKFKDKIIYIVVDEQPKNIKKLSSKDSKEKYGEKLILNGMARDYFQRDSLLKGLKEADREDLILISDLDEIPNLENINLNNIKNEIIIFEQKILYYKLNLLYEDFTWQGTRAIKYKNLVSPQWLRNIKGKNYPKWRLDTFFSKKKYSNLVFVKNGGWHFTCLKTPEQLEKKLLNYAHHYEYEVSGINIQNIRKFMEKKRIIYDYNADQKQFKWSGKGKLKKLKNKYLPKYVENNLKKYSYWLD
jgi:beta-1,4-mannosyl-glycoprotein beta-1,4-N-acetylglucosaminyltransferase